MDTSAWLVFTIYGLCLDICGVVILAAPLLNINYNIKNLRENVEKQYIKMMASKKIYDAYDSSKIDRGETLYTTPIIDHKFNLLYYNINRIKYYEYVDKLKNSKNTRIALIIITTGFLLIIVGNVMQVHY